jgi:predicted PurR-regulated permease PerM
MNVVRSNVSSVEGQSAVEPREHRPFVALGFAVVMVLLIVAAVAFDRLAAKGVLIVGFLSVALAYLIAPLIDVVRRAACAVTGSKPSLLIGAAIAYIVIATVVVPIWLTWGRTLATQVPDVALEVPKDVARFVEQVRAGERWHERFSVQRETRLLLTRLTARLSGSIQTEVHDVAAEIVGARKLAPWLWAVPALAFLLVVRWTWFHRSAARGLPTPHLQWRSDQFFRHVNQVMAAYTRAQALSALFVGAVCSTAFTFFGLPSAITLGIVAGLLELIPIAGPIAVMISATAVAAHGQALIILVFLAVLRVVQDYGVYPHLIQRTMHLHPLAVIVAIWLGAAVGGIVGVVMAVPVVGVLQVALRHWREYRDIERLVTAGYR